MRGHLITFAGHGTYSPDGKVDVTPADAATITTDTNAAELAHWHTKPEYFAPAYFEFPAEQNVILGVPRSYRANFTPNLCSYINQSKPGDPGTALHAVVKTWHGSLLGRITSARVYRHNFGGRIVSLRLTGTNGATYYGRASWDNGSLIRLRRMK